MSTVSHAGGRPRRPRRPRHSPATQHGRSTAPSPAVHSAPVAEAAPVAAPQVATSFSALGVPAPVVEALGRSGVTEPFAIQAAALPDALAGRDILGRARTGSGKTVAFAVPVAVTLTAAGHRRQPGRPGALILVPTRELAAQVTRTVRPLAEAVGLRCATIHGGVSQGPQVTALRRGTDVLVATPGRLEDLVAQGHCRLDQVRTTVLDEADLMADLGFLPAVRRLLDQTPSDGQRLLFSATLDEAVTGLADRYLRNPAVHSVDPPEAAPGHLEHHVFAVEVRDKAAIVAELASGQGRSLLFTRTKHAARKLAMHLTAAGIPAADLHANLTQRARERNLASFADGTVRVLVATDIAARGIHVDDVALVVHVDPPAEHKAYLHRSGRTARAGASGVVVTVATPDQTRGVKALLRKAKVDAATAAVTPGDSLTAELVGPPAERRITPPRPAPAPKPTGERRGGGGPGRGRRRPAGQGSRRG